MKTSNKILWGSFAGILITSIMFLVVMRIFLVQPFESGTNPTLSTAMGSREIAMSGFVAIIIEGHWEAELSQGNPTKIHVEGPQELLETLSVQMQGEELILRMAKQRKEKRKLILAITMPEMNRLQTKGVTELTFERFDTKRLSISSDGVSTVRGWASRVGALELKGRGVSRVKLEKVPAGKAVLDYKGVFNIDLTMDGGELEGNLKGVGDLRYRGKTSRLSIRQEGPCKVIYESNDNRVQG
jgi:hypothetical protein